MKIVIWQPVLTEHQVHTVRALSQELDCSVEIIVGKQNVVERQIQGWAAPQTSDLNVAFLSHAHWWKAGKDILIRNFDAIHIFNSLWGDYRFFLLLIEAQRKGIKTSLVTEPYSEVVAGYLSEDRGVGIHIKALLRPHLYHLAGMMVAKKLLAVFTISEKAQEQFIRIGVKKEQIFPFGYFVPKMSSITQSVIQSYKTIRLVFIGSLLKIKGIKMLMDAMQLCYQRKLDIHLDVYGPGDGSILEGLENVTYKGVIAFGDAQSVISAYDILVLPSLHDGWGVVINEALLQGVPALVSDQVGAKAIVKRSGAGAVFKCGDIDQFVEYIQKVSEQDSLLVEWKKAAVAYQEKLMPAVAASYMKDCLKYVCEKGKRPDDIWY